MWRKLSCLCDLTRNSHRVIVRHLAGAATNSIERERGEAMPINGGQVLVFFRGPGGAEGDAAG
jgi:hypothetical protein